MNLITVSLGLIQGNKKGMFWAKGFLLWILFNQSEEHNLKYVTIFKGSLRVFRHAYKGIGHLA